MSLTVTATGIPEIICSRCANPVRVDVAVAAKWSGNPVICFVCITCAEKLKKDNPTMASALARDYFEALLTVGRPRRIPDLRS